MASTYGRDPTGQTFCPDCRGDRFIEDRSAGDVVCYNCGLVVEAHIIDERSEWRTFSDKDKEHSDPNRVGGPTNPLLEGGGLSTIIGKGRDGDNSYMLNKLHTRSNNPDRALISAFKKMGEICEMMQMSSTVVKDSACEIYKMAHESGRLKGRGVMPICAACLYLACRQNNVPRSFKEITAAMPAEVSKKDIGRCFQDVMRLLKENASTKADASNSLAQLAPLMRHPADFMKRFSAELRLDFQTQKVCHAMALAAKPKDESQAFKLLPWDSRSPLSVAAAILYAATCIKSKPDERVSMQDIVMITNVAQVTIKSVYRELYSHMEMLLPPGISYAEAMSKLPVPEGMKLPQGPQHQQQGQPSQQGGQQAQQQQGQPSQQGDQQAQQQQGQPSQQGDQQAQQQQQQARLAGAAMLQQQLGQQQPLLARQPLTPQQEQQLQMQKQARLVQLPQSRQPQLNQQQLPVGAQAPALPQHMPQQQATQALTPQQQQQLQQQACMVQQQQQQQQRAGTSAQRPALPQQPRPATQQQQLQQQQQ